METIISADGEFEMGFFSPGNSKNRYFGIWYKKISPGTVVWVANRDSPLPNHSGALGVNGRGICINATSGSDYIIWSSKLSEPVNNPMAQLLDTGNLVFRDGNDGGQYNLLWQSFDYPGDNLLPGMKLGVDLVSGLNRYLTSWKSVDDPSPGDFTYRLDPRGFPQFFIREGSMLQFRTAPWFDPRFSGNPSMKQNGIFSNNFVHNQIEIYYRFDLNISSSGSVITRLVLTPAGVLQRLMWHARNQTWQVCQTPRKSDCDRYTLCGAFGACNVNNSPRCECLRGFDPKIPENWAAADWADGCVRNAPLNCRKGESFVKYSGFKLPCTRVSWYNTIMSLEECERMCLKTYSCNAYSNTEFRGGGSGCLLWLSDLNYIQGYSEEGQDLYVRMGAEFEGKRKSGLTKRVWIILILVLLVLIVLLGLFPLHAFKKTKLKEEGKLELKSTNGNEREDLDLPLFDYIKLLVPPITSPATISLERADLDLSTRACWTMEKK